MASKINPYSRPMLQVALDYEYLQDAVDMTRMLHKEMKGIRYFLEVGTPLIKNQGLLHVIPRLRAIVGPMTKIVADMKTMDTGALEVELAHKADADFVAIAGAAEMTTIDAALEKAAEYSMPVLIDSINAANVPWRLEWLAERIVKYNQSSLAILEYHILIDMQTRRKDFKGIRELYDEHGIPIAAAGGLDENTIPLVVGYGARICVVGGVITRPVNRTSEEAIKSIKDVVYNIEK